MLYAAVILFGASMLMVCLDLAGFRFAHGAGPTATLLMLVGLASLAAKAIVVNWRHGHGQH
jgi:hypothetical protein